MLTPDQETIYHALRCGQTVRVCTTDAPQFEFRIAARRRYGLLFYAVLSATSAAELLPFERFTDAALREWIAALQPVS